MALARDAQSSGDPVLAENYLQHAEHYNRIILAYREQQIAQGGDPGVGAMPRQRPPFGADPGENGADFGEDDGDDAVVGGATAIGLGEQPPTMPPQRFEGGQRFEPRQPRGEHRQDHQQRGEHRYPPRDRHSGEPRGAGFQDRGERPERSERQERPDRPERGDRGFDRPERPERGERPERIERAGQPGGEGGASDGPPRRRERFQPQGLQHEQPEFLRRPVRRPRRDDSGEAGAAQPAPAAAAGDDQE